MTSIRIQPFLAQDLNHLDHLQPEGWPDLTEALQFYHDNSFCYPIKAVKHHRTVGLGALIVFEKSAWLAHIIVDKNERNQGIGQLIVSSLLQLFDTLNLDTCTLIATELGYPVYLKFGFKTTGEYTFMECSTPIQTQQITSHSIQPITTRDFEEVIQLDFQLSGEERQEIIRPTLNNGFIYRSEKNGNIEGYYLPDLREGPIYAQHHEAGKALLQLKLPHTQKGALPTNNSMGIAIWQEHGFQPTGQTGIRMELGKPINWNSTRSYSRIAGKFA